MSIRDDLKAFIDGELNEQRAAEVRLALESDPQLKSEADALKAISNTFRLVAPAPAPIGLEATLDALQKAKPVAQPRNPWRIVGLSFAGVAATAVIVAVFFPVFSQAKEGAKSVAALAEARHAADVAGVAESPKAEGAHKLEVRTDHEGAAPETLDSSETAGRTIPTKKDPYVGYSSKAYLPNSLAKTGLEPQTAGGSPVSSQSKDEAVASPPAEAAPRLEASMAPKLSSQPGGKGGGEGGKGGASPSIAVTNRAANAVGLAKALAADSAAPRLIINNGDVGLYVTTVKDAKERVEAYARASGGYVEASDLQGDKPENQTASLRLRVPVSRYPDVLARIKALGEVNRDSSTGTDVTSQVVDTEARLRTMRSEEAQYQQIMKSAKKISDVLDVKERLGDVRQQIESLDAEDKSLRGRAALSTIQVQLSLKPKETPKPVVGIMDSWPLSSLSEAVSSLADLMRGIATLMIYLLVFAPIWGPAALLTHWGLRMTRPQCRY